MTLGKSIRGGSSPGSNPPTTIKKMVKTDYPDKKRSAHDRRSIHVRLTDKGRRLRDRLTEMHHRHAEMLSEIVSDENLQSLTATLRRLERFWIYTGGCNHPPQPFTPCFFTLHIPTTPPAYSSTLQTTP